MIKLIQKNCKFLITGATGFIGSKLCQELLQDGHQIVALTRQKNKISAHKNLKYINDLDDENFNYREFIVDENLGDILLMKGENID